MATEVIRIRVDKETLLEKIRNLPKFLTGQKKEVKLNEKLAYKLAIEVLTRTRDTFIKRSNGEFSEGVKWKPLDKKTVARKFPSTGERGLLSHSENARWKAIFRSMFLKLVFKHGQIKAKEIAAKVAWSILKSEGAKTKLEIYGNRKVPMLRDSDILLESLSPGELMGDIYYPKPLQKVTIQNKQLLVETLVPYAEHQNKLRPLLPKDMDKIMRESLAKVKPGLLKSIINYLKGN